MLKATDGNTTVYYTRGFELISRREGAAASYYVYDGGLSVRALTNEAGTVKDTLVTDSFGNETGRTGTTDNPYGFQGEEQDSTGLYYLRARYMDPATGTFTTMDTYGGSLSDPMSLHKYLFANSNPVMYSDPSGHISLEEFDITAAIDSMLESVAMDLLEWAITDPECEEKTFGEHVKDLFIDMAWGFFSGGFGSCISKKIGADSLFGSVKDKLTGFPQKLSLAEKYALGAIFILSFIAIPVGIVLKAEAENTDDIHLSNFLNGLGDAILDTYYIILSKLFNCPSALVPAYIDAIVIISKHGDE